MHCDNITKEQTGSWQDYIATVWAGFLGLHNLPTTAVVIEVGPGFSGKTGLGLAQINFEGTLYVIEQDIHAIKYICSYYEKILPNARIIGVNQPLASWCRGLPVQADALLMNHLLDDLILYAALSPGSDKSVFSNMQPEQVSCQAEVYTTWESILNDSAWREQLTLQVLSELHGLLKRLRPALLGMSQYESWFLTQNHLQSVNKYCQQILAMISADLGLTGEAERQMLIDHGQKPEDWLLLNFSTRGSIGCKALEK